MATYTSYLNLKKPEGGERYALADFNANMQAIDDFAASIVPIKFGSSSKSIDQNLADYWTTYIPNDSVPHLVHITAQYGVCVGFLSRYSDSYGSGCLSRYEGTIYRVCLSNGSVSNQPLALNSRLTSINLSLGSFTTTTTNAWENTGLTITVPSGHCFIGNLQQGYNAGRPLGIGVNDSSSLGIAGIPLKSAYDPNGLYSGFVMLTPGTWYVFSKRSGTGTNNYSFRYFDFTL